VRRCSALLFVWSSAAWAWPASLDASARAGTEQVYLEGDGSPSDLRGFVFAFEPGVRLSRRFALGTSLELSLYPRRSDRLDFGALATSGSAFVEARAETHPGEPFSAAFALGSGYRRLWLPLAAGGTDAFWAIEALRLRAGPSFQTGGRLRIEVTVGGAMGWFFAAHGAQECAVTGACPDSLYSSATPSVHFTLDLSIAVRG
jgi:hypothetical protein